MSDARVDLNDLIGQDLEVQGVHFTEPRMPPLLCWSGIAARGEFLKWRGGCSEDVDEENAFWREDACRAEYISRSVDSGGQSHRMGRDKQQSCFEKSLLQIQLDSAKLHRRNYLFHANDRLATPEYVVPAEAPRVYRIGWTAT